mmetsp:Transcript_51307/g.132368  ORF Transcript_51307/g.132368 Transcript_51307/m.132368 type:complete len:210 (+) Transcript_51307:224-853(+)
MREGGAWRHHRSPWAKLRARRQALWRQCAQWEPYSLWERNTLAELCAWRRAMWKGARMRGTGHERAGHRRGHWRGARRRRRRTPVDHPKQGVKLAHADAARGQHLHCGADAVQALDLVQLIVHEHGFTTLQSPFPHIGTHHHLFGVAPSSEAAVVGAQIARIWARCMGMQLHVIGADAVVMAGVSVDLGEEGEQSEQVETLAHRANEAA